MDIVAEAFVEDMPVHRPVEEGKAEDKAEDTAEDTAEDRVAYTRSYCNTPY